MSSEGGGGHRVALVAGASRGLGLLVCRELLQRGFVVHGCARDADELARAAELLADAGALRTHVGDVRSAESMQAWVDAVLEAEGRIDAAIHVAGVIQVGPEQAMTLGHFRDAIDTMLWGPVHLSLAVLPAMRAAGRGRLGIVSSVGGLVSVPRLLPYSVAKFGAVGLAEGLAAELAGTGVTATSVTPGLMRTGGHLQARFAGDAEDDYTWFAPGASLPLLSVSAERAARRIVDGVLAGKPTVELTPLTMIGSRVHGLAPATTVRVMGLVSRLLPDAEPRASMREDAPATTGAQARDRLTRRGLRGRIVTALSTLGDRAARPNNDG